MKKSNVIKALFFLVGFLFLGACSESFVGEYSDPKAVEIVDDRWNETDARKSAEVLINSMLSKPWLNEHLRGHEGKRPMVVVDTIENRTDEHIDTKAIGEAIRDEILNSGQVRFADLEGREKILKEMKYQNKSGMVSANTAQQLGKQIGAQFMLTGNLSSSVHSNDSGLKTVTYQIVLKLTNFESAEIVWSQKYDIKKRFKRSSLGW